MLSKIKGVSKVKVIRISAVWCSSCILMKSRFNEIARDMNIDIIDLDYDLDYEDVEKYNVSDVLPVYIKGEKRLQGEHTKEEIRKFLID